MTNGVVGQCMRRVGRWRQKWALVRARLGHEMLKAALTWDIIPSQSGFPLVGVTGFEPATSSSRTTRATKLRHTPIGPEAEVESSPSRALAHIWSARGTRVSRLASGRQAKRYGACGLVPRPAETCSAEVRPPYVWELSPLTLAVSRSQFVVRAP